jgi:sugar/nucleoside kinase (ribokinase family)
MDAGVMTKILVVGELNVDLVLTGLPSLPVVGRELIGEDLRLVLGSSSAITAVRLAALGAHVDFAGIVGKDDFGHFVLQELERAGVGTQHIQQVDARTGATIALTYSHDRALVTYPGTIAIYEANNITPQLLAPYNHVHVGAFFLQDSLQPKLPRLFQMAHDAGLTTSLDVGWDPREQWSANPHLDQTLAQTDYFFPNESEAAALIGADSAIEALTAKTGQMLIVKRGPHGASAYDKQGKTISVPSLPVQVVDTTGAGDAFNAGFLYAYRVEGQNLDDALRFAAACGSQAVTQIGGATGAPTAEEVRRLIEQNPEGKS